MNRAVLSIAFAFFASAGVQPYTEMSRPLQAPEAAMIRHAVTHLMLDPDSARFRMSNLRLSVLKQDHSQAMGGTEYCGAVNGKNTFGGYTGFQLFEAQLSISGGHVDRVLDVDIVNLDSADARAKVSHFGESCLPDFAAAMKRGS